MHSNSSVYRYCLFPRKKHNVTQYCVTCIVLVQIVEYFDKFSKTTSYQVMKRDGYRNLVTLRSIKQGQIFQRK